MAQPLIERIGAHHDCDKFRCNHGKLQLFIRRHALANDQNDFGVTHVAVDAADKTVVGYYTLSSATVRAKEFPEEESKFHYTDVGVILIGMLAVHKNQKRKKIGEGMLIHLLHKAEEVSQRCGAYAVVVDSLPTEEAIGFYTKYGFQKLKKENQDGTVPMFIFMRKVREMLDAATNSSEQSAQKTFPA